MKNICILPWIAIDRNRHKTGEVSLSPCCIWKSKKTYTDINTFWNNEELVNLRKEFLAGKRASGCDVCWKNEDAVDGKNICRDKSLNRKKRIS